MEAYTDAEAASEFDDQTLREAREPAEMVDEPSVLRYIDWSDEQVKQWNADTETYWNAVYEALRKLGLEY
jgi:hypothetical protein